MSWALAALQIVLAGTFALAAIGKLLRSDEFVAALRLSHLPEYLVRSLLIIVPLLELGVAGWLLLASPDVAGNAFATAFGLLAVFTIWMAWVRLRRLPVRCGCFGPNGGEVGTATIGRNLVLLVLAGFGWVGSRSAESTLPGPSPLMAALALALILIVALIAALRFAWPHLTLSADRLGAGGMAGE
jgi:hypothetical protein